MQKRLAGVLILCAVLTAAALASVTADGKGKGHDKMKISGEFANFPLPFAAELVAKSKQKAAKEWTEYSVLGFSLSALSLFYKNNMPGHGWKLGHYKGNTWLWRRGKRSITVVFVRIGPFCLIQVRET